MIAADDKQGPRPMPAVTDRHDSQEARMFHDFLKSLAAAGTANAVSKIRIDIADAATAGKITPEAADSLQAIARVAAESIAVHGERRPSKPAPAPAGGEVRHPATITECGEVSYDDSGEQIRGTVALADGDTIRFTIRRSWSGSLRALFGAAGVDADEPAEALAGQAVEVVIGAFTGRDGNPRPCVKKWFRPAGSASTSPPVAKPAASKAPAWEADDQQVPRAPRRTTAQKAAAEFKAQPAVGGDDIPF